MIARLARTYNCKRYTSNQTVLATWYTLAHMDTKPKVTPKEFFLWAGAMITLYASVFAFISLIFSYLDYAMPDALSYYSGDPYASGISYEMASLLVLFPIFLVISHIIIRDIVRDATRADVWIRRWAIYLTLFVAGATIAGDLITLIMYFFNGDVTLRFALKVLVVLLVAGGGFLHYLADLHHYWSTHPSRARMVRFASAILILVTIVAGFFIVGTPMQARLYRYDEQKVSDLQTIQYQIVYYWQAKQVLPETLADLADPLANFMAPQDPQTGVAYEYSTGGRMAFELCATFNAPTQSSTRGAGNPLALMAKPGVVSDSWQHDAGRTCFTRTIDPERYPPVPSK